MSEISEAAQQRYLSLIPYGLPINGTVFSKIAFPILRTCALFEIFCFLESEAEISLPNMGEKRLPVGNQQHGDDAVDEYDTEATMYFLPRDELYKTEKPYTCRYDTEGAFPPTNIRAQNNVVKVLNMRPRLKTLQYEDTGFKLVHLDSEMKYEDYEDRDKIKAIHIPEVEKLLKNETGASHIYALDHVVSALPFAVCPIKCPCS